MSNFPPIPLKGTGSPPRSPSWFIFCHGDTRLRSESFIYSAHRERTGRGYPFMRTSLYLRSIASFFNAPQCFQKNVASASSTRSSTTLESPSLQSKVLDCDCYGLGVLGRQDTENTHPCWMWNHEVVRPRAPGSTSRISAMSSGPCEVVIGLRHRTGACGFSVDIYSSVFTGIIRRHL